MKTVDGLNDLTASHCVPQAVFDIPGGPVQAIHNLLLICSLPANGLHMVQPPLQQTAQAPMASWLIEEQHSSVVVVKSQWRFRFSGG